MRGRYLTADGLKEALVVMDRVRSHSVGSDAVEIELSTNFGAILLSLSRPTRDAS